MAKKVYKPDQKPVYKNKEPKDYSQLSDEELVDEISDHNRNAAKKARRGCLIIFLVIVLIIGIASLIAYNKYNSEVGGYNATALEPVSLTIESGSSSSKISALLEENGLIGSSNIFKLYIKFVNKDPEFKAGTFTIVPGSTYDEIIDIIAPKDMAGITRETVKVQIPEGNSIMSIASKFEEAGLCTAEEFLAEADNLNAFNDLKFVQKLQEDFDPNVFHNAEGYLFPDTYEFFKDDSVHNIVRKLYEKMDSIITDEMYARMDELGISLRETITLASLIQAEAGHVDQQAKVAGVFWNRLDDGWAQGTLGSDVTLRYVKIWMQWNLPEYADKTYRQISYDEARTAVGEDLFYAYVTDDSDSRSRVGLPTGPICSVSLSAINAALYPEEHNYYYFLTDFYENYYYAETYQEHLANVATMNEMNEKYNQENGSTE